MNYFESFSEILRQFTSGQRVFVLVLLLAFTCGTYIVSKYLQRNSCVQIIKENVEMQKDFAEISKMLREERMQAASIKQDTIAYEMDVTPEISFDSTGRSGNKPQSVNPIKRQNTSVPRPVSFGNTNDKILKIADKYSVKEK